MPVKRYKWPFPNNPHTLMIQNDGEDRWSMSVCGETAYVFVTKDGHPEFVVKGPNNKIIKKPLEELKE